jgi:hypothetical protein
MGNKNCIPPNQTDFVFKNNLIILIYNLIILTGAAYIIVWKNQPGAWIILALLVMMYPNYNFCKNDTILKPTFSHLNNDH